MKIFYWKFREKINQYVNLLTNSNTFNVDIKLNISY